MYVSDGQPFMVVSPDGSLRSDKDLDSTVIAVEFKCPVFQLQTKFPQGTTCNVFLKWKLLMSNH